MVCSGNTLVFTVFFSGNNQQSHIINILLASFAWSIPGPITYGTDSDEPVTFAFFCFCFICTLFELVIFTNEMANHFGFD